MKYTKESVGLVVRYGNRSGIIVDVSDVLTILRFGDYKFENVKPKEVKKISTTKINSNIDWTKDGNAKWDLPKNRMK